MKAEDKKKKLEALQEEVKAMQRDPLLQEEYGKKVLELIKMRRSLIRAGKKK